MPATDRLVGGRHQTCRGVSPLNQFLGGRLMKKISAVLLVAILAGGLSSARAEDKKADTASELKALDTKLTDAFKAREFEMLAKHLDEKYMLIDPRGGVHNKKKYLKHLT